MQGSVYVDGCVTGFSRNVGWFIGLGTNFGTFKGSDQIVSVLQSTKFPFHQLVPKGYLARQAGFARSRSDRVNPCCQAPYKCDSLRTTCGLDQSASSEAATSMV